jgi:XTP/dITP diphosphohydrolase
MEKLLIATQNPGKILELSRLLSDFSLQLMSLRDVGITDDVEENGKTYEENSRAKALFYAKKSGLPAISDDGGLEISALNGEPGIHSRRWLGHRASDEELISHMKKIAKQLPDNNRNAYFRTVVTLALKDGRAWSVEGVVKGMISRKPYLKMLAGYPYRSFFFIPEINKFYHENELSFEEQKIYNHRYKAVQKLKPFIEEQLLAKKT